MAEQIVASIADDTVIYTDITRCISNQGDIVRDRSLDFRQRKNAALSIIRLTLIIVSKWVPLELLRTAIDSIANAIQARDEFASIVGGTSAGDTGLLGMAEILSYLESSIDTLSLKITFEESQFPQCPPRH